MLIGKGVTRNNNKINKDGDIQYSESGLFTKLKMTGLRFSIVVLLGSLLAIQFNNKGKFTRELDKGRIKKRDTTDSLRLFFSSIGYDKYIAQLGDSVLYYDNAHRTAVKTYFKKIDKIFLCISNNQEYKIKEGGDSSLVGRYSAVSTTIRTKSIKWDGLELWLGVIPEEVLILLVKALVVLSHFEKIEELQSNNFLDIFLASGGRAEDYNGNALGVYRYLRDFQKIGTTLILIQKIQNYLREGRLEDKNKGTIRDICNFVFPKVGIEVEHK